MPRLRDSSCSTAPRPTKQKSSLTIFRFPAWGVSRTKVTHGSGRPETSQASAAVARLTIPLHRNCYSKRQSAGTTRLKIQQTYPGRRDGDAPHGLHHLSHLRGPGLALLRSKVPLGGHRVFRHNSVHRFQTRRAATSSTLCGKTLSSMVSETLGFLARALSLGALGGVPITISF